MLNIPFPNHEKFYYFFKKQLDSKYIKRRTHYLSLLISDILISILLTLNFIFSVIPFTTIRAYLQYKYVFEKLVNDDLNENYLDKQRELIKVLNIIIIHNFEFVILGIIPQIILLILSPWNILDFVKTHYNSIIVLMKNPSISNLTNKNNSFNELTVTMIYNMIEGYKNIIKFLFIKITLIRAFFLYYDFYHSIKYSKPTSNLIKSNIYFSNKPSLNQQTISKYSNSKLYLYFLHKHFQMALKESWAYPIILISIILTPWNFYYFVEFFEIKKFSDKVQHFIDIMKSKVLYDIFIIVGTLALLLSIIHSVQVVKLIYYSLRKRFLATQFSIEEYDIYYKQPYKNEIAKIFKSVIKKIIVLLLIILNFILLVRIFSISRRLSRFIKAALISDYMTIKSFLHKKDNIKHKYKGLEKLKNYEITTVSVFLRPGEIILLSLVNKALFNKMNSNLVWESQYENYFSKKVSREEIEKININQFSHHKKLCFEVNKRIDKRRILTEVDRDILIGYFSVALEETIESLLKLPHLVLLPIKIISVALAMIYYFSFRISNVIYTISMRYFGDYIYNRLLEINLNKEIPLYTNLSDWFYNIQYKAALQFLHLLFLLIISLLTMIYSIFMITVKLLCLTSLKKPMNMNIRFRDEELNLASKIIQVIYAFLYGTIMLLLSFYPIYYFSCDRIISFYQQAELKSSMDSVFYLNPKNNDLNQLINTSIEFILLLINYTREQSIFWFIRTICGKYFSNLISIFVIRGVHIVMLAIFFSEGIIFCRMGKKIFAFERYIFTTQFIYPHLVFLKLFKTGSIILVNIYAFLCLVVPIYIFFKIKWTFYSFVFGLIYNIMNVVILVRST